VLAQRRFVRNRNTPVRSAPSGAAGELETLTKRRVVRVVRELEGWTEIDVKETGRATGFCLSSALTSLDQMPV
jgi:hypothetical protein